MEELDSKKKTANAEHISEIVTEYIYKGTNASGASVKNSIQVKFNDTLGMSNITTIKS